MLRIWYEKTRFLNDDLSFRSKVSFGLSWVVLIIYTITFPVRHMVDPLTTLAKIQLLISYILNVLAIALLFHNPASLLGRYSILVSLYLITIPAFYYNGGLDAPVIPLILLFPILSGFLINQRASFIFFVISFATLFIGYMLWINGFIPETKLATGVKLQTARLLVIGALLALAYGLSYLYETTRIFANNEIKDIQDGHPSGIAKINRDGVVYYENKKFIELMGESINGQSILHRLKLLAKPEQILPQLDFNVNSQIIELEIQDEKFLKIEFKRPIFGSKSALAVYITDTTLQYQQLILEKKITAAEITKSMVVTYNHRINNPLTIAIYQIDRMRQQKSYNSDSIEKAAEALDRIGEIVKKM